jgi:chaperonin GroES
MNSSGIIPMDKRVLVKPDSVETKTAGGIILPDSFNEKKAMAMMKGTVVAIGETAWFEAEHDARNYGAEFARPAPGARVLIGKYSGVEVTGLDGESYRLMNDEDVIGRLEEAV